MEREGERERETERGKVAFVVSSGYVTLNTIR